MATTIAGISSMAMRQILADLADEFEIQTRQRSVFTSVGGIDAIERIRAGAIFDVIVLSSDAMTQLENKNHIMSGSVVPIAISEIAIAVPSGAIHPKIHDAAAVRQAIFSSSKICYSTGPSGNYLVKLWESWGISTSNSDKMLLAPAGTPVGKLIAEKQADIGFQQLSELLNVPGIDIIGRLPEDIQQKTVFAAGIGNKCSDVAMAREFIVFLASEDAEAIKRKYGMHSPN